MITIFSTSKGDSSTCEVIDWLYAQKTQFKRINLDDLLNIKNISFQINNESKVNKNKGDAIWFRRGKFALLDKTQLKESRHNKKIIDFQLDELDSIIEFLFTKNKESFWLNHPHLATVNKLNVLEIASEFFCIPQTIVTNSKRELLNFKAKHTEIIAKPISENKMFFEDKHLYMQYSAVIRSETIDNLKEDIFPTLAQEYIRKRYEIRSFYLDGEIYSMAIFSQKNDQTKIDFRNYDFENKNRFVPYRLKNEEENKARALMSKLGLNSGSIDFIRRDDNKLIFLEVNPVGQFEMLSKACNYYIEEDIARLLTKKSMRNE